MKIILAGATGFIGRAVVRQLAGRGDAVTVLSRRGAVRPGTFPEGVRIVQWDGKRQGSWSRDLDGADAVVNLSGEAIGGGRWTPERKVLLLRSRVDPTNALVLACRAAVHKPSVFVNVSAVGYYQPTGDAPVTESDPAGTGFLPEVSRQWEDAARGVEGSGTRLVLPRMGIVLGPGGGALERMLLPFRLFIGGPLGSGRQWFPWVHRDDVIGTLLFALDTPGLSGPVNVVAPEPVTMSAFAKELGSVLHRPSWLPVPAFVLRALLGELSILILGGRPVIPSRLLEHGYRFTHPRLGPALRSIL